MKDSSIKKYYKKSTSCSVNVKQIYYLSIK
jgi:hypothetical protein